MTDVGTKKNQNFSAHDTAFLHSIAINMPIVADVTRSDILIYHPTSKTNSSPQIIVKAQARPHSVSPTRTEDITNQTIATNSHSVVRQVLQTKQYSQGTRQPVPQGAPVIQKAYPINHNGRLIGVMCVETNLFEHERQRRRKRPFQIAVRQLQDMLRHGELKGGGAVSPFGEHDGILAADPDGQILYASGIATNLYRRFGYVQRLVSGYLYSLKANEVALFSRAMQEGCCLEEEFEDAYRSWNLKAIPLIGTMKLTARLTWEMPWHSWVRRKPIGALLLIRDNTEAKDKERELNIKTTMIKEIHHRVKNNLQTIASLLRMQTRRVQTEEARTVLQESTNRILSVAMVHEFLSLGDNRVLNIKDISHRITQQMEQVVDPDKPVRFEVSGFNIYLSAHQATACALVVNELLQNAMEHAYERRKGGNISVNLADEGDRVVITVSDDGAGLPDDFDLDKSTSLGLQIVRTLVREDLKGKISLTASQTGTRAIVDIPKQIT